MSVERPVLVTGTAAVTCCGLGSLPLWECVAHRDAARRARAAATRPFPPLPTPADNRLAAYVLAALEHDLGPFLDTLAVDEREGTGVVLGSTYGYLGPYLSYLQVATEEGYQLVNPRHFPSTLPNCTAVSVSDAFSLWGCSTALATGLGAGLEAIAYAAECIRRGDEHTMLAGACEELNPATARAADPNHSCPGEGVGILLLQSSEVAAARGRRPLALCGAITTRQGVWWDAPGSCAEAIGAILDAVAASDLGLGDIAAIFPSAGGSARGDQFERELLQPLFDAGLRPRDIVPIKAITGECFAASGALQYVAAAHYLGAARGDAPAALVYAGGYDGTFAAAILRSAA